MDLVLYILVSASLGLGLARLIRRIPLWVYLVLFLVPLLVTWRPMFTTAVLAPADLVYQTYPHRAYAEELGVELQNTVLSDLIAQAIPWKAASRASWYDGEPPLWNPWMLGGDALAATVQSAPYEPIFLTSLLLPLGPSLGYIAAMTMFLAGLGMYLFLRELGLDDLPALFGALAWTFGGFLTFWLQWAMGLTCVWLPFVLLGVRRSVRSPGIRSGVLLTVAFSWMLLSGHTETAIHIVYTGIAWAIVELVIIRPDRQRFLRIAATGLLSGVVAVLLTAFFLAPIVEALPQTLEYHWRKERVTTDRTASPATVAARLISPVIPHGWGYAGWSHTAEAPEYPLADAAYPGSVALLVSFCGVVLSRRRLRWWLLALGSAALVVAAEPPVIANLTSMLPGLGMSLNQRFDLVTLFAVAALAALGIEALLDEWRRMRRPVIAFLGLLLLAVAAIYVPIMSSRGLTEKIIEPVTWWYVAPLLVGALLLAAAPKRWNRGVILALFALVLIQRSGETEWLHPTVEKEQFYPALPILDAIPEHEEPFRIVGTADTLIPATSTLYGLEDVRGYQALSLMNFRNSFTMWAEHQPVWSNRVDDLTRPFISALNVRYAIMDPWNEVPPGWSLVRSDESGVLVENENFIRRVFVPQQIVINTPPHMLEAEVTKAEDFSEVSWVYHPGGGADHGIIENGPGEVLEITVPSVRSREVVIDMDAPGWVVVSESFWEEWKAFTDGKRLPLRSANVAHFAFHLGPGVHEVELIYSPRSFLIGSVVSLVTLLICLAVAGYRLRRRPL